MKSFFKILGKSLIGVPLAIFFYELLNLTISILMEQYVRVDLFNLRDVINNYITLAFTGYLFAIIYNYLQLEKDPVKVTKKGITVTGIVFACMTAGIIADDVYLGLLVGSMFALLMCAITFIIFLFNRKEIENINSKIKENQEKKD